MRKGSGTSKRIYDGGDSEAVTGITVLSDGIRSRNGCVMNEAVSQVEESFPYTKLASRAM